MNKVTQLASGLCAGGWAFLSGVRLTLELLPLPSPTHVLPVPGDGPDRCTQATFSQEDQERGQVPLGSAALWALSVVVLSSLIPVVLD